MFYANLLAMRKQRSSLLCHFCTFYPSTHAVKHAFFVFGLIAQRRSGFSPEIGARRRISRHRIHPEPI